MVSLNFPKREMNVKIVYYGPALSGKTTNLETIHKTLPDTRRGQLLSLATQTDRTLFFDLLPLEFGEIEGFATRFHLYTVPGQVMYNTTRKKVLTGADGVVFVADSQPHMVRENLQSLENLAENLASMGRNIADIPLVLQYNKRDMPNAMTVEDMNAALNPRGLPWFESVANRGDGVVTTLTRVSRLVVDGLRKSGQLPSMMGKEQASARKEAPPPPRAVPPQAHAPGRPASMNQRAAAAHPGAATAFASAKPASTLASATLQAVPKMELREEPGEGVERMVFGKPELEPDGSILLPIRMVVVGVEEPVVARVRLTLQK